jgi:hypothetical protein
MTEANQREAARSGARQLVRSQIGWQDTTEINSEMCESRNIDNPDANIVRRRGFSVLGSRLSVVSCHRGEHDVKVHECGEWQVGNCSD